MNYDLTNPSNNYSYDFGRKLPRAVDLKMYVASDGSFLRANCAVSLKRKLFEEISVISATVDFDSATEPGKCVAKSENII